MTKPIADPACVALANQIRSAREEGTPAKVHAVANGKTKTVRVKRESLAKVAELDKLNSEFQTRCSKYPGLQTAAAPKAAAPVAPRATAIKQAPTIAKVAQPQSVTQPIVAVPR